MTEKPLGPWLHVANWEELQHYSKRNPPWIKLYRRLLHEGDFQHLTEAQQWQLVRLWLASAEEHPGGWISSTQRWLQAMTGSKHPFPLRLFVEQGWLTSHSEAEYASAHASARASKDGLNASAGASKNASALLDTETQKELTKPAPLAKDAGAGQEINELDFPEAAARVRVPAETVAALEAARLKAKSKA